MESKTMKKRILLVGINFSPELTGIGKYSGEMINWMADNDNDCTVVTTFPYYPTWSVQKPYSGRFYKREVSKGGNVNVFRCPIYVPAKPTGAKRILHDASFFFSSFLVIFMLLFKKRHDYIICMAPPFHIGFLGLFYRFFKGGELVYHIHDMQIEAARDFNIIKSDFIFKVLFKLEHLILKHTDHLSTISTGMIQKVNAKIAREIILFPNWVDTELFSPLQNRDLLKQKWGFNPEDKVVCYSGSIGEKQGLESLIQIAKQTEKQAHIKYVICGNGPYRQRLMEMAAQLGLVNMHFMDLQPLETFNVFLNMTDVHLVLQKKSACDLMMPSKLTTIWSSGGLALVTAQPGSTLYKTINNHNMAVVIDCEDDELLKQAIVRCCNEDLSQETRNARTYAISNLSRANILTKFMIDLNPVNALMKQPEQVKLAEAAELSEQVSHGKHEKQTYLAS
jgi:colanic acid biosynthesis glycosyl transferase WcaI